MDPRKGVVVESRDVVFNEGRHATAHSQRVAPAAADTDKLVVQPALICKRGSGVVVRPWGSQQGHEKRSLKCKHRTAGWVNYG